MAKKKVQRKVVEKRPLLGDRQKEMMLAVFLRDRRAFDRVRDKLHSETFNEDHEVPLRLLWSCALSFVEDHDELPGEQGLKSYIQARIEDDRDLLTESQCDDLDEFIDMTYALEEKDINAKVAYRLATRYLEEKLVEKMRLDHSGDVPLDLPALLEDQIAAARSIASVEGGKLQPLFASGRLEQIEEVQVTKTSTQIDFFDAHMRGGMAAGEVYGIVAPFGVGKTTIGVTLCVLRAKKQLVLDNLAKSNGTYDKSPVIYLACWEEEASSIKRRLLSTWAKIPSGELEDSRADSLSTIRRPSSYKEYERRQYRDTFNAGGYPPGERERLAAAIKGINRYIRFVDFTGSDPKMNEFGADMAKGLSTVISNDQEDSGSPGIAMVVVDHADAAADMSIEYNGFDPSSRKRHLIGGFPRSLKNRIAAPYQCPVWVLHQLAAQANERAPGQAPKATDHKEAKDFFEYVNFGWLLGTKTEDGLCILVNGKHRRNEKQRNTIIRIDGATGHVANTNGTYRIDRHRIVSAADYNRVARDDDSESSSEFGGLMERGADDDADTGV